MLLLLNYVSTPAAAGVVGLGLALTSQDDNTVAWTAQTTLDGAAVAADAAPGYTLLDTTGTPVGTGQMTALSANGWYYGTVTGLTDRGHMLRVAVLISDTEAVAVAAVQNTIELAAAATIADAVRAELTTELGEIGAILEDTGTTLPATLATLATAADLATVNGNVDAILEDTGTTLPATLATVDGNVDAILEDTGTTLPATLATLATADANGNVKAVLYGTQPAVTFGQVKILADVSSQGALHVVNSNADGQGVMYIGGEYGQVNSGVSSNVVGVDEAGIRAAIGLATADLDTQLAALPTDQDVRDAMKLAPTAGDPAAGSMDKHLDDLLTYADAAEPADVWSYVSRTLTATPASTTDGTTAGAITRKRGNSWSIALTLGAITGYTSLWFTIKRSYDDADSASVVQVKLNATGLLDGLLYVNGAAATNDALGSITVSDASTGAIVVALDETVTDDIAPGTYYYDAQALISGAVTTPDSGTFTVTADVTRSVT